MKKVTSLMTLLLMFVCTSMFAQQDPELTSVTRGGYLENFTTDTWYLLYQRRGGDGYAHYEDATTRFYKRAETYAQNPFKDGMTLKMAENWLVKFVAGEAEGTYKIQFANGAYWVAAGTGNGAAVNPTDNKYDATDWAITRIEANEGIDAAGNPVFTINVGDVTGKRLDNNGNGGTLSMWDAGMPDNTESNAAWSIVGIDLGSIDPADAAMEELKTVLMAYADYSGSFTAGTNPGNYGEAEVTAFEAALEAGYAAEGASLSAEDLKALTQAIKDTYDAVVASRVPFATTVTPGYYYIQNALDFTETTPGETIEDPETGEEITTEPETVHFTKALYTDGNNAKWKNIDKQDANFIWQITAAGDKTYHLINAQTEAQFNAVATSTAVTLSAESDSLVVFDVVDPTNEHEGAVNIRLASQAERGYFYLHCDGHGGGAGKEGNIVGWATAGASDWNLVQIEEAEALAIIEACSPAKKLQKMIQEGNAMANDADLAANLEIAKDITSALDEEKPLIKDPTQFHSPQTTDDTQTNGDIEAVYPFLLDGQTNTYWHSRWEDGNRPNGADYIQVSDIEEALVAFKMTRRPVVNDHVTQMSVYGYDENDDEIEKTAGEKLAEFALPYGSNTEVKISPVIETKGHTVLRFYAEATTNNRGYWHMSEFQIYPATVSQNAETTQYVARNFATLEEAVAAWNAADKTDEAAVTAALATLKAAYEPYKANFVNPAALRQAIANAPSTEGVKIGTNPGEWSSEAGSAIAGIVEKAKAYDNSGLYTPAESEKYIADLQAAEASMYEAANKVKTGKWYRIRFATAEEYEAAGWDAKPAEAITNEEVAEEVSHALFGKLVTVTKHVNETFTYQNEQGNDVNVTQYNVEELSGDDATFKAGIAFMDKNDLKNEDAALWQFVNIGDSAYVLQNKLTGLYMRTGGAGGQVTLSLQPTTFNTSAIGYGKNLIKAVSFIGENHNYLHAERSTNNLVQWNASTVESNSALYIEEAGDVTEQPTTEFTMTVWPGSIQTMCYPASIEAKDGKFYLASVEGTTVTLNPIEGNKANAGQPVVYIADGDFEKKVTDKEDDGYNAENVELATFTHGNEFVAEAAKSGALVGSFAQLTIGLGNMWAENEVTGNSFAITKKSNNSLGANTAYIEAGLTVDQLDAEVTLVISGEEVDGIENAIATVSKVGGIYTLDGKFVAKGNLNNLKAMPKGIYVVNGVKVAVK